jgi:hypothetical protein
MSTPSAFETWHEQLKSAKSEVPEVVLFGQFALLVCIVDKWLTYVGPKSIQEMIVPFTGWVPSMPYMFGLIFTSYMVFGRDRGFHVRQGIIGSLVLYLVLGVIDYFSPRQPDFGNPYLIYSPWRPVWTVAIPLAWILLLVLAPIFRNRATGGSQQFPQD